MAEIIIASFFTDDGDPAIGLIPTIRIWEVEAGDQTLVIGAPEGTQDPGPVGGGAAAGPGAGNDGTMVSMNDSTVGVVGGGGAGGSEDGFYKYTFDTAHGYDPTKCYLFRVDGGVVLTAGERWHAGELNTADNAEAVVDLIYDEPRLDHNQAGSIGEHHNQTRANLTQLALDITDVYSLVNLLTKFETNRTRVDSVSGTLTVYDDDCVTPLRTFALRDGTGAPSTTEICERAPIASGTTDGRPTCA
jgi:hypothetical protein